VSYLMRPRAHFKGRFTVNPPTANNDKVSLTIDEPNVQPYNPQNLTDEQFRVWMMQTKTVSVPGKGDTVWLNGYYNYFGDHGMRFSATDAAAGTEIPSVMTSSTLPDGTVCTPEQDPFLTGQVELLGHPFLDKRGQAKMVDLDPIGIYGTQVFSGLFQVVVKTADGPPLVMLSATNPSRAYIYDLYTDRNIAVPPGPSMLAAIWQMALPLDGLKFNFGGKQSPTLSALQAAAQSGRGLVVEYVTYYSTDVFTEKTLGEKYEASGYKDPITNESSGFMVGTIGAWSNEDPLSTGPSGRLFYGTYPLQRPTHVGPVPFVLTYREKAAISEAAPPVPPPYFLGPIAAWVDMANQNVVLDFSSTIPEVSGVSPTPSPNDLTKKDYGDLTLKIKSGGQEQTVGTISYDRYNRSAYEFSGGIIEVPFANNLAGPLSDPNGSLHLYGGDQTPLSDEIAWAAVSTDDRCVYLHVNEIKNYSIRPLWKGQPMPNQAIPLTITQWKFTTEKTDPKKTVNKRLVQIGDGAYVLDQPANQTYTTNADGYISLSTKGLQPGAAMIRYQAPGDNFNVNQGAPGDEPPDRRKNFYFGLVSYNIFRVLPADDFSHIPDEQVTWDFVYENVIRYFYLIYPAMFVRMAFQNEEIAQQNASIIRQFIDKRIWDSTSYMPVSRDLSDGKRDLLARWCTLNE
jgi:hypothetical protein